MMAAAEYEMSSTSLFVVKLIFAAVVAAVGLSGSLLPWIVGRRGTSDRVLALSDTFAGGVLGGAGLIHLLSSGADEFRIALPRVAYPLALLLAGAGFLLILLIEGVVVAGHPGHDLSPPRPASAAAEHEIDWHPDGPGPAAYPVILLVVLSVHSVILGLALGAQSALSGIVIVFLAIVAHKGAAGFALGVGYQRSGLSRRRALPHLGFFTAMTPLGIVVGASVGVALTGRSDALFQAVFDSLGAGTFLYIAALDIIKTEFDNPRYHAEKWGAAVLGFAIMAVLAIWI